MKNIEQSVFHFTVENQIGWVTIDVQGDSQNTLKASFVDAFNQILDEIENHNAISALIVMSGKPDNFISGADISMLKQIQTAEQASELAQQGQQIFNRLENLKMPVVAAINGACLGGGLELALACSHRIATDEKSTRLGLPEVQLGLLPGSGGTQRLPRLIGIAQALTLMLTGKQLVARQAKKVGLVDEVVPLTHLKQAAVRCAQMHMGKVRRKASELENNFAKKGWLNQAKWQQLILESHQYGRDLIFNKALQNAEQKTRGNYPAPDKIIRSVKQGLEKGFAAGLALEAELFGQLVVSKEAKQLINIFFATTALKKETGAPEGIVPTKVERLGVLGGGLMGAGVAYVSIEKAFNRVRLKDTSEAGINHALKYCWNIYRQRVKRKHITISEASRRFARLSGTTQYRGFKTVDLVIEAVFEDLNLKQQMVCEIEKECHSEVIFATNTSSIPIADIASASKHPERVIGMHYFSPVEKMPLLEIVVTEKTSPQVIATCVALGKAQGKTVIVVNDGAGFYTSRILAPFINEAGYLLVDGVAIDQIDNALQNAGFPVGPLTLLDEVGIDVGSKIAPILVEKLGQRFAPPEVFSKLIDDNRKGKKNNRGFYQYQSTSPILKWVSRQSNKQVDSSVYPLLGINVNRLNHSIDEQEIAQRCLLQMVNEAVYCLQENIINSPRDGDIGAIFGLGFPPFLGGPFRYVDSQGAGKIVEQLRLLQNCLGDRFKPAEQLVKMAENNETFY
ncbi:fatty acid oxidation complex subunit alpha FadJ [Aliikangiella maris]|uniref:Fatty acid oxidation complex subunit alpha FadJ n=2 Tax=Aliikangiella maris TaxID=3162458 RepID=A0ABV3MLY4_9GAMM